MERRSFLKATLAGAGLTLLPGVALAKPLQAVTWEDIELTRKLCCVSDFGDHANNVRTNMARLHDRGAVSDTFIDDVLVEGRRTGLTIQRLVVALTYARLGIPTVFLSEGGDASHSARVKVSGMIRKLGLKWSAPKQFWGSLESCEDASGRILLRFATKPSAQAGHVEWLDHVVRDHRIEEYPASALPLLEEKRQAQAKLRVLLNNHTIFGIPWQMTCGTMLEAARNTHNHVHLLDKALILQAQLV